MGLCAAAMLVRVYSALSVALQTQRAVLAVCLVHWARFQKPLGQNQPALAGYVLLARLTTIVIQLRPVKRALSVVTPPNLAKYKRAAASAAKGRLHQKRLRSVLCAASVNTTTIATHVLGA
jgi:hypothetical protein